MKYSKFFKYNYIEISVIVLCSKYYKFAKIYKSKNNLKTWECWCAPSPSRPHPHSGILAMPLCWQIAFQQYAKLLKICTYAVSGSLPQTSAVFRETRVHASPTSFASTGARLSTIAALLPTAVVRATATTLSRRRNVTVRVEGVTTHLRERFTGQVTASFPLLLVPVRRRCRGGSTIRRGGTAVLSITVVAMEMETTSSITRTVSCTVVKVCKAFVSITRRKIDVF